MLNLPRWQVIAIIVVTALAGLFALPNALPGSVLNHLPGWYTQSRINLGLDLRGGAYFLLEADLRGVLNERLANLSDSVRGELRKQQIGFKDVTVQSGASVTVVLREEAQRAKAIEAMRTIDPSLAVSGEGDTIRLAFSEQELVRKKKEVIDQSIEILRRRVDETGTIEPTIVRQGDDRIELQMPGIKDTTDLKRKINQTAKLTFHLVNEDVAQAGQNLPTNLPPTTFLVPTREGMQALRAANPKAYEDIQSANPRLTPEQVCRRYQPQCLPVFKRVVVGGEDLDDAKSTFENQQGGRPIISFTFNTAGGRAFCNATAQNIGKRLAISSTTRSSARRSCRARSAAAAESSPASSPPSRPRSRRCCCARARCRHPDHHRGAHGRRRPRRRRHPFRHHRGAGRHVAGHHLHAGVYGPVFGGFASIAMMVNMLLVFAGMSILGASLTLPGIAGLVLTVGMSVDSNVLIYERVREEKANGRSPFSALGEGYGRALTAVIDFNLTALIAGVLLFGFGSGPIRGFATSLTLGLLTHLFTATVFTRMLLAAWVRWRRPTELPI